jgi:AbrB family looped-hinge helix DNA binding protein
MISHMDGSGGITRLDDRGRLVLPVEFRRRLGLRPGDEVRMSVERDGALRIESRRAAAHALIGIAGSSPRSAVDLLREDRDVQAGAEDVEADNFARKAAPALPPGA